MAWLCSVDGWCYEWWAVMLMVVCCYKQNQLAVRMDSRIYFHQYRRPRVSNPTYLSSNVQNSMSFFNSPTQPPPRYQRDYLTRYNQEQTPRTPVDHYRPQQEAHHPQQDVPAYRPQLPYLQPGQQQAEPRASSKLSNYGERSLVLDQRGVHDKQTSKFDIINLKPREHSQDIKQYPWLTVENRDDVYYRRMNQAYNPPQSRAKTMDRAEPPVVAGRHTYDLEPKIAIDPEKGAKYFSPKMLNHMDELQHNLA